MINPKLFFILFLFLLSSSVVAQECSVGDIRTCGDNNVGECSYGTQYCTEDGWSICVGLILPEIEECEDGKDNDCDGEIDEGCDCVYGDFRTCGPLNETGSCLFGSEYCNETGVWSGICLNATYPTVEMCGPAQTGNLIDDDCDGEIDETCIYVPPPPDEGNDNCTNRELDEGEEDVDCGGPDCPPCPTCSDGIKNQGEIKTNIDIGNETYSDCGGPDCPPCPTCSDGIKNQGEEDVDCGGLCPTCSDEDLDQDDDGLTDEQEISLGTSPIDPDTDDDGILDGLDEMPFCPNYVCDVLRGENYTNCPIDCVDEATSKNILIIIGIIIIVFVAIVLFFVLHFKSTSKKLDGNVSNNGFPPYDVSSRKSLSARAPRQYSARAPRHRKSNNPYRSKKQKETLAEKKLRKSLEK